MLYICMSVAGSIPVILCLILWLAQKQSYNYRLGKNLLLLGMFFYLVPFQAVKYMLPEWTVPILKHSVSPDIQQTLNSVVQIPNVLTPEESIWIPRWLTIVLTIWFCLVVAASVYQVVKYRIDIRKLLADSEKISVDLNGETVEVLVNKKVHSLYTVGFIRQSIIVPEESLEDPYFLMCYRHEDQHRKSHDSLMKLLCIVIICIHWFNPIAIVLLLLYRMNAEYICDASAAEGCSDEEKREYGRLLIELSSVDEKLSLVWKNRLSDSEKLMTRRINYLMKSNKMMKKGIAVVVMLGTMLASVSTILAYEPFVSVDDDAIVAIDGGEIGSVLQEDDVHICDFSISDTVILCEDGTEIPVAEGDISGYALCNHVMEKCYFQVHTSNSSGGCTAKVYNAQRCKKCNFIDVGSLYATHTYTVCPHDF